VQGFLLDLRLKDGLTIELEFAVRITESVAIGRRQICAINDIDTQRSHIVDTFARIELHLNWNIFKADLDVADVTLIILEL
jgi:hypothetical protein